MCMRWQQGALSAARTYQHAAVGRGALENHGRRLRAPLAGQGAPPSRRLDCHLMAPPVFFVGVPTGINRGCHQNDSLADGQHHRPMNSAVRSFSQCPSAAQPVQLCLRSRHWPAGQSAGMAAGPASLSAH